MSYRACTVSFVERGAQHSVDVDAESVYEAAALALKAFRHRVYIKGPSRHAMLEIQVQAPTRVKVKVADVLEWLYQTPGRTAQQTELKKRLRDLLADDRH